MQLSETYFEHIKFILLFGLLSFFTNWVAKSQGFYFLPKRSVSEKIALPFHSLIAVFAIYLTLTMGASSLISSVIHTLYAFEQTPPPFVMISYVQLTIILTTLFCLYMYTKSMNRSISLKIFKNRSSSYTKPIYIDLCIGAFTWLLSFPLVIAIGQLSDLALLFFTGIESYEQVAVHYLKMTIPSPPMLIVSLFTILIAAPAIEELLFRGFLQTYLKRFIPIKMAILISSLCFALFHLAPSQGLGNISLIISLFTFALFLGFIYEKQASLFASFALHMTFNTMSTIRILFFTD